MYSFQRTDYVDPLQKDITELTFKNRDLALDAYDIHRELRFGLFTYEFAINVTKLFTELLTGLKCRFKGNLHRIQHRVQTIQNGLQWFG